MIGTSFEMLYYFSLQHETQIRFGATRKRMNKLREQIVRRIISEDEVNDLLSSLDCVMIRPKYILPSIVQDRTGKIYDENTFFKSFATKDEKKIFAHRISTVDKLAIPQDQLEQYLKSKGAKIIQYRTVLPSVWSYEPDNEWLPEHTKVVHRILGFS